ncbi:MAG: hypothetical protein Q4B73_07975 [Lachnospiraceae bacterium]|nr:hypothetical protein [Lachnospiraceae bacterium]
MKKKIPALMALCLLTLTLTVGCGSESAAPAADKAATTEAADKTASENEVAEAPTDDATENEAAVSDENAAASDETAVVPTGEVPEDGIYSVIVDTHSPMFHLNETCEGRAILTVKDGQMTVHMPLVSKNIVNLFSGTAEEAKADGAVWIQPTEDNITYPDGWEEVVYGFDVPVPYLDADFPVALIGKEGKWYDHTVTVSDPQPAA